MLTMLMCLILTADPLWMVGLPEVPQGSMWVDEKGENAIVLTLAGEIVKVDLSTGKKLWERGLGSFASCDMVVSGGRVLASGGGRGKTTKCFDLDGKHLWEKTIKNVVGLALNDDMAVIQALDGKLIAVDAATGVQKWQKRLIPPSTVASILTAEAVIAADGEGTVLWLNRSDGSEQRRIATSHTVLHLAITGEGMLVCLSESGVLEAWDGAGDKVWQVERITSPADMQVTGKLLLIADALGEITAYGEEHGAVEWHAVLGEPLASHLWCSSDRQLLAAGGSNGTVKVWSLGDGSEVATLKVAKRAGMVAATGDLLLVGSNEMKLRAYKMDAK
jgi:outer membrane protein assembly factor BamB